MMMKSKKRRKILAALTALVMIGAIVSAAVSMTGNPISAYRAKAKAEAHIKDKYSHLVVKAEKAEYNFKDGNYWVSVKSDQSPDTHFTVFYRNGIVTGDDYEFRVLSGQNTMDRLSLEYSSHLMPLVSAATDRAMRLVITPVAAEHYNVPLDAVFDTSYFSGGSFYVEIKGEAESAELVRILRLVFRSLKEKGYSFDSYGIADQKGHTLMGLKADVLGIE